MKISKHLIMLGFLCLMVFAVSCSEDDDNGNGNGNDPSAGDTYFKNATGSYWIYNYFDLDEDGNEVPDTRVEDSVVVTGTDQIGGKNAIVIETFSEGESIEDYLYVDGDQLWAWAPYIAPDVEDLGPLKDAPIILDDMWVKIADFNANSWGLDTINVPKMTFNYEGIGDIDVEGDFMYFVKKGTAGTMDINGTSYKTQEFNVIYKFDGEFTVEIFPMPIEKSFEIVNHYIYAEGIGLVKRKLDPTFVEFIAGQGIGFDGNEKIVKRYFIQGVAF